VPPGIPLVGLQKLQASFRKIGSENHPTSQKSIHKIASLNLSFTQGNYFSTQRRI